MTDFQPLGDGAEFPPINPGNSGAGVTNESNVTIINSLSIPDGSVTDAKLANGIDPRKIAGVGIKVYLATTAQTITTGSTGETITFNTVSWNQGFTTPTGNFTTVTAPYQGVYILQASIEWSNLDTGGRQAAFLINGSELEGERKKANNTSRSTITAIRKLSIGDTVALHVEHDVGSDTDVSAGEDNCSLSCVFMFSI